MTIVTSVAQKENGSISYRLRGDGPLLILVSTLSGTWLRQLPVLPRHFTVLTYDMRGFGASPSSTGFPANEEHADDLAALLDEIGADKATVVGLSHGGLVAQHFAARHPGRLAGLALVSTFGWARDSTLLFLKMLYGFLERDDLENFWAVLRSFLFSAEGYDLLERRETALRQAMFDQYTTASLRSIYGQALAHDIRKAGLDQVRCPALVVGGQQDMLFPPPLTKDLASLVPGARLEFLPAAHVPPVEAAQPFNDLLISFFGDLA
jgi:3-oxoadipate enol-lactonase